MKKWIPVICSTLLLVTTIHTNEVKSSYLSDNKLKQQINTFAPFSKEMNMFLNSETYKQGLDYIQKVSTPYPNIMDIESENANEIKVKFSQFFNIEKAFVKIVNENGKVHEIIHKDRIKEEEQNIYSFHIHNHLKNEHTYILEIEYLQEKVKISEPFTVVHPLKYYQSNYEVIDDRTIKISMNKSIGNVGYFYPSDFNGYISRHRNNDIYIKLDKPLEIGEIYNFNIKYSSNSYGLNIDNIYGYFIYQPNKSAMKIEQVVSLNHYQYKVRFSKNINLTSDFFQNKKDIYVHSESNEIYYPGKIQYISDKEILVSFHESIPNGDYYMTINNARDYFDKAFDISSFPFSISLLQSNNNYPIVKRVEVLDNNKVRLFYDKPLNEYFVEKVAKYQLINTNDLTTSYKVINANYDYRQQSIDVITDIDVPNQSFLIVPSGIKDSRQREVPTISHEFKSKELSKVKIMNVDYKFIQKGRFQGDYYFILTLNKSISENDIKEVKLINQNKTFYPEYDGNKLYFKVRPEMFGKKIDISVKNNNQLYGFSYSYNVPHYENKIMIDVELIKKGKENYLSLSFSEPYEFDAIKHMVVSNTNQIISYGIIDNRKDKEKYIEKAMLKIEKDIKELPIDIFIPFENAISLYQSHKIDKSNIGINISNYTFLNKPSIKKVELIQNNLIRVELSPSTVINPYFASDIKNNIGVTDLKEQKIIDVNKVKLNGSYIDIYTDTPLSDNSYAITLLKGLLVQENNPSIKSNTLTLQIKGYDFKNTMTPYLANEWTEDKSKNEILISYEGSSQYAIFGEQGTVEPKSYINFYTSDYKLIGTSYGTSVGSFGKIAIPNEYLEEDYFILESIDEKGNISRMNIVF